MPQAFTTQPLTTDNETRTAIFPALIQLPQSLLDYSIAIKRDFGAVNILKRAMSSSKDLHIDDHLALGPTTPLSLRPLSRSRILWAIREIANYHLEARILDHAQNHYTYGTAAKTRIQNMKTNLS